MRHPLLKLAFAAALASNLIAQSPLAQPLPPLPSLAAGQAPTRGPEIPTGVVAGDADATSVVLNAANLAFLPAWNLVGLYSYLDRDGLRGPGGGGLYFAAPMPFLNSLVVGGSVELVRPPSAFPYGDGARLSIAAAYRPIRTVGFGATYTHVFLGDTPWMAGTGMDTLDLSFSGRLGRYAALSLVVHDVPSPSFHGFGVQRVYEPAVAFRPTGDSRLEIGLSARIGERRGDVNPSFRLFVGLYPGVHLRTSLDFIPDIDGTGAFKNDLRATAGLELDLAHVGFGAYAFFGRGLGGGAAFQGVSATLRISGDRYPSFYTPMRLERVDLSGSGGRRLDPTLAHLRALEHDPKVDGIVAVIGSLDVGWATAEELRAAMERLRAAGKHVFAYGVELSMKSYYVAAAAERIYLDPAGGVRFVGLSSTSTYFKGSLDLLSVKAEFVKIAEYKSAPEQFTREGPSPEAAMVKNAILDDVNGRVLAAVAADRHLDPARVTALVAQGLFSPPEAKKAGLVDDLKHGDEIEDAMSEALGHRVQAEPRRSSTERARTWERPAIAVLFVEGDIVEGKSRYVPFVDQRFVGQETIIHALEAARGDARVKAIVLRIDSPGGSALASDLMAREINRSRKAKPIICSFGDVAASGGYFIASYCDVIYADPSTITGSIGIFTGKFDLSGLTSRLGVQVETNKRGEHADIDSLFRLYTDEERRLLMDKLKYFYGRFIGAVAEGRSMKPEEVDAIGRGRVWTGRQALEKKLVDHLGGFVDALGEARRRGGLGEWEDVELQAWPAEPKTLLGEIAQLVGLDVRAMPGMEEVLRPVISALRMLPGSLLVAPSTPQARLPFFLNLP